MNIQHKSISRVLLITLSIIGVAIMGYLFTLHTEGSGEGSFCDIGEGLSCSEVNQSLYSEVLGIPVSVLGVLYFLGILGLVLFRFNKASLKLITFGSIIFLGPSLYLTWTELYIIHSICIFCEISKVIMLVIIGISIWALKPDKFGKNMLLGALVGAIVLGGITYFIHAREANAVPLGYYNEFAQCITESGFIMYGSEGCSSCARQRDLFGDSFEHIIEIECSPRFEGAEVERCVAKKIDGTPTWIQETEDGSELQRLKKGWQTMNILSEVSGCKLPQEL